MYDDFEVIVPSYLSVGDSLYIDDNENAISESEDGYEEIDNREYFENGIPVGNLSFDSVSNDISYDYSEYLSSINDNLILINESQVDYTEKLNTISDNCFRLYYFIGGLYIVFFIVLAIKFFKQFF